MDFIKKLPMSDSSHTILVIIDCLTKQSIFISTVDTIMSPMLAKLFVLHIFSKHGVPSHVTKVYQPGLTHHARLKLRKTQ